MLRRRTTKIVAVILALIIGIVFMYGYTFVYNGNIPPEKESNLDFMV